MQQRTSIKSAAGSTIVSVFNTTEKTLGAANKFIGTVDNLAGVAEIESYSALVASVIDNNNTLAQQLNEAEHLTDAQKDAIRANMPAIMQG